MEVKEFFNRFRNSMVNAFNMDGMYEKYEHSSSWTPEIRRIINETINSHNVSYEYYRIDTLAYKYTQLYNDLRTSGKKIFDGFDEKYYLNVYNWKNEIAVEYENSRYDWTDELVKLSHIRADLKVIICYSEFMYDSEKYRALIDKKLEFAIELLNACEPNALKDNWLIIFGPAGEYENKDIVDNFVGYELIDGKFAMIK